MGKIVAKPRIGLTVWEAEQAAFMMAHCKNIGHCMGMGYGAYDGYDLNIGNLIKKLNKFISETNESVRP